MSKNSKNIFVSHIHEDEVGIEKLKDVLEKHGVTMRNYSITSDKSNNAKNEDYIKQKILTPRIQRCSVLAVYITPETKDSPWTDWEIRCAEENGKRIIGIWAHGEKGCELPEALKQFGDAVVGWSGDQIIDAINGDINEFEYPNGSQFPLVPIERFNCR